MQKCVMHCWNCYPEMFMLFQREHYLSIVKAAKQRANLLALRELRRSEPVPPMVSRLDLDNLSCSSEDEEQQEGEGTSSNIQESSASVSSPAKQCVQCGHLKQKVSHLESLLRSPAAPQMPHTTGLPPTQDTPVPSRKKYERVSYTFKGPTPHLGMYNVTWFSIQIYKSLFHYFVFKSLVFPIYFKSWILEIFTKASRCTIQSHNPKSNTEHKSLILPNLYKYTFWSINALPWY